MQGVKAIDIGSDERITVEGLARRLIREARNLRLLLIETRHGGGDRVSDVRPLEDLAEILESYYEGAHERVIASEPVTSFRKLSPPRGKARR